MFVTSMKFSFFQGYVAGKRFGVCSEVLTEGVLQETLSATKLENNIASATRVAG